MRSLLALTIAVAAIMNAQEKPAKSASPGPLVHQFIELKNLEVGSQRRYDAKEQVKKLTGIEYVDNADAGVLAISGTLNQVKQAEQLFQKFDVSERLNVPKQIQSTLFLLQASDEEEPGTPSNLQSVVAELKKTFPYRSYKLLDAILMQSSEGANLEQRGILQAGAPNIAEPSYYVQYQNARYSASTKTFSFNNFRFSLRDNNESSIQANLMVREGQQLVLGKLNQRGTSKALFVVLSSTAN